MADERILVIEHDIGMVDLLVLVLSTEGYQVDGLLETDDIVQEVRRLAASGSTPSSGASQGFSLSSLIREYAMLRSEIWRLFRRYLPEDVKARDVLVLQEAVDLSLDRIVELTITSLSRRERRELRSSRSVWRTVVGREQ